MKVVIVGGVAGGAGTAARLRRNDETAEIIMLERGSYISYANCGLPYYIGGVITDKDALQLQTPERFHARFNVDVRVDSQVVSVDTEKKCVVVRHGEETYEESYDKLADVMGVPHMDADQLGYINHKPLVWPNECARHKLLDVIGDLALIGKPIKGRIIATRPGHTINNKFARQMRKEIRLHEIQAPTYDCNREPVMDVNRIRELLPHRYPFQLVDKVIEMGASYIVGIKNITANEPFFQGHFPQEPVMPGVLQIEAMAQVGGLLVLNSVDEPERYSTYFMKIDGVKFRQKVVPGDTLLFRVELLAPIRRGISTMKGYAFVGEKVVCEAEFMAQIVKNK